MRILITAGGTSENIDSVGKITNSSSDRLGAVIAEQMLQNGHDTMTLYTSMGKKQFFQVDVMNDMPSPVSETYSRL